ncbi:SHOCT domain-containing protein [Natrinema sp. 1APR25-10V2]|uniref:SHOCT domain-containing protein n=1 Tax=Natrinema sp. 1APR25-10V2 TaxID=2951081 RepID=UPI002876105D|nr:SHOCT domain-containing protein [Natrinema sp. 1APR25-10V2]MDS0474618.1 SHOCT domain-containing protein [Natrinema sp. 1APR25-10V2]
MTEFTTTLGRTARRFAIFAVPLLIATTGSATAHGGGSYSGSMMGGWGIFGGGMGLWGLLWMGLLIAAPLYLVFALARRGGDNTDERSLSVLRERYARGELTDDEFERQREQLDRSG